MATWKKTYTGPNENRGRVDGKAAVSKEELADFKRQYGSDKTLRDLLNADRSGKLPKPVVAQSRYPSSVEGKRKDDDKKERQAGVPAPYGEGPDVKPPTMAEKARRGLSDTALKILGGLGAAGAAYGGYRMYKGAKETEKALMESYRRTKAAEEAADRAMPTFSAMMREKEALKASEGARKPVDMVTKTRQKMEAREKAMESAKDKMKSDAKKPKASPRSRTEEKEDIEFRKGGAVKKPAVKKGKR